MARFKDVTGRPGPATWKLGTYPDGEEDLPVSGLSWYEAAAYAAFAGKELPTVYHWYQADTAGDIQLLPGLVLSGTNHDGSGPRRADASRSMSAYGAIDMAGNVREWSASASDGSTRIALGGAWSDPAYQYLFADVRSPFDRSAGNGLRCMKRLDEGPLGCRRRAAAPHGDRDRAARAAGLGRRVRGLHALLREAAGAARAAHRVDRRIVAALDQTADLVRRRLRKRAHDGAAVPASRARPPYQVVIQMAGAATFYRRSSATEKDIFGWSYAEYLIRGGRAVMIPIWKGSYERSDGFHPMQTEWPSYREHIMQWVSELRQSVNYLQSRDDMAGEEIAYQGISNGAIWAPIFLAMEPRIKTGILLLGGLLVMPLRATDDRPRSTRSTTRRG